MRKKSDVSACVTTSPGEDKERIFRHRICFCGFPGSGSQKRAKSKRKGIGTESKIRWWGLCVNPE